MRKLTGIFILALVTTVQISCDQTKPDVFADNELSRFDDLLESGEHDWVLTENGESQNSVVRAELSNIYPEGVTWERCSYSGKFDKTVDRWIIIQGKDCSVYEWFNWSWGGVFGYIDGVRSKSEEQFNLALKKDGGSPPR